LNGLCTPGSGGFSWGERFERRVGATADRSSGEGCGAREGRARLVGDSPRRVAITTRNARLVGDSPRRVAITTRNTRLVGDSRGRVAITTRWRRSTVPPSGVSTMCPVQGVNHVPGPDPRAWRAQVNCAPTFGFSMPPTRDPTPPTPKPTPDPRRRTLTRAPTPTLSPHALALALAPRARPRPTPHPPRPTPHAPPPTPHPPPPLTPP
jgi:hypothetical protein